MRDDNIPKPPTGKVLRHFWMNGRGFRAVRDGATIVRLEPTGRVGVVDQPPPHPADQPPPPQPD